MNQEGIAYRRLPGASWWSPSKLYLGPDHLLIVQRFTFTESCWRFDLKDILACVVHRSARRTAWAFVWGILLAGFVLIDLAMGAPDTSRLIVELLLATIFIWNIALGPTCNFSICTAVQQKRVVCIRRTRRARALLAALRPLIEQAQGAMPDAEFRQQLAGPSPGAAPGPGAGQGPAAPPVAVFPVQAEPARTYWGSVHLWLAVTILAGGVGTILAGMGVADWMILIPLVLMLAQIILAAVALVKQSRAQLPGGKTVPWLAISYGILAYVVYVAWLAFEGASGAIRPGRPPDFSSLKLTEMEGMICGVISIAIGIYGLAQHASWQSLRKRQTAASLEAAVSSHASAMPDAAAQRQAT